MRVVRGIAVTGATNSAPLGAADGTDAPAPAAKRRNALITGASAGIGQAFAHLLAERGFDVVLVARRRERLDAVAAEVSGRHGVRTRVIVEDLADATAPARIDAHLRLAGITIDVLVNNAGYSLRGDFLGSAWQAHRDFLQVLMLSVVELTHRLLPGMVERGYGRVINVSSLSSFAPEQRGSLYGPVKRFVTSWTRALSLELAGTGVHVTASCPGFTTSEFHDVLGNRQHMDKLPQWLWMSAEAVALQSWEAVERNEPVAIPGKVNQLIAGLCAVLPRRALLAIAPDALTRRGDHASFGN